MHSPEAQQLEAQQNEIARAILSNPRFGSASERDWPASNDNDAASLLNIYRNNTFASLTEALLAVFPVTAKLVDERYFRYASNRFISAHPPREPVLVRYGAAFPDFLHGFEQLEDMAFVAETARLEWLIACALEEPALVAQPLTALSWLERPEQAALHLQPSMRLIKSGWPVLQIWLAHQDDAEFHALDSIGGKETERLALWRSGPNIRFAKLDAGEFSFLKRLADGASLDDAAIHARSASSLFDLASGLARIFQYGLVTAIGRRKH